MIKETVNQIIARVWGERWKKLPINLKVNLRYNYKKRVEVRNGNVNTK